MALFVRAGLRRFQGARLGGRSASTAWKEAYDAEERHAIGLTSTWRNIFLFGAVPLIAFAMYNAYTKEQEHKQHIKEHGRPEFIPYSHLRIRNKPFPWGDGNHSLFHNPKANALPEGYEDDL